MLKIAHCCRAAFKFGRRMHFALRRKMLKTPICSPSNDLARLIKRPSGKTDCTYEANVKWPSTRPQLISFFVNSKRKWRKWLLKLISAYFVTVFCLAWKTVPKNLVIWAQVISKPCGLHYYALECSCYEYTTFIKCCVPFLLKILRSRLPDER